MGADPATVLSIVEAAASGRGTLHLPDEPGGVAVSRLWERAHGRAAWMRDQRTTASTVAGILEPTIDCLATLLACWLGGRTFVSLPTRARAMTPAAHRRLVDQLVDLSEADLVLAPTELVDELTTAEPYDRMGLASPAGLSGGDGGALVQFTSGTTGDPEGIHLTAEQMGANARSIQVALDTSSRDVFFSWLPLSHDMGLIGMFLAPLAAFAVGGAADRRPELWISRPDGFLRNPAGWLQLGSDVGGTVTMAPSFALDVAGPRFAKDPGHRRLDRLRVIVVGAETVRAETLTRAEAVLGPHGLGDAVLCPGYGLADATLAVTTVRPGHGWTSVSDPGGPGIDGSPVVSLGPPVPGVQVRIGTAGPFGPIEVQGPSVGRRLADTAQHRTSDGWLETGDLGFLHDGELHFVGREDNRLVVAGRTVDAELLRSHLGSHPGLRPGCCAVVANGDLGFDVVVEASPDIEDNELPRLCRAVARRAADAVGAVPNAVVVVERGTLPKTPSGKLRTWVVQRRLRDDDLPVRCEVRLSDARRWS